MAHRPAAPIFRCTADRYPWLAVRMATLGRVIVGAIVHRYGREVAAQARASSTRHP